MTQPTQANTGGACTPAADSLRPAVGPLLPSPCCCTWPPDQPRPHHPHRRRQRRPPLPWPRRRRPRQRRGQRHPPPQAAAAVRLAQQQLPGPCLHPHQWLVQDVRHWCAAAWAATPRKPRCPRAWPGAARAAVAACRLLPLLHAQGRGCLRLPQLAGRLMLSVAPCQGAVAGAACALRAAAGRRGSAANVSATPCMGDDL